ncbi:MAG: hypothetical protein CL685_00405 [Candidatus Magasanikbacteria bacterium]|nr:hypothetical protein [Candidatus Magasanikbacteria bacterium]|tara:strand:+ start:545 stop:1693 length:1149 start_codon:yes stop_codon:yes gene_type:complete
MALSSVEQIFTQINKAKHILVTFPPNSSGDAIASACALRALLQKKKKQVEIVSSGFSLPKKYEFLDQVKSILPTLPHLQKFMITVDVKDAGLQEVQYDVKNEQVCIYITPKTSFLTKDHVQTTQSAFRYDLIITLNTPNLETLGDVYIKNQRLFHDTPVINIDHKPNNEHFGDIHMIDITACATSEILTYIFFSKDEADIDEPIATALLTGMIANTQSFKTEHVNPKTLHTASKLMHMGAQRHAIISSLYQTKTIPMLRLWGYALAHIIQHKDIGLVLTSLTRDNIIRSEANVEDVYDIIDELILYAPEKKMVLLLHETEVENTTQPSVHAIFYAEKHFSAKKIMRIFNPKGDEDRASFYLNNHSLAQAKNIIISEIKKHVN